MSKIMFISAYTIDSPYETEVMNLERSLKALSLPYNLYGYRSLGSWEANCQQKAFFILKALTDFKCPIVWTDADSVIEREPVFFYDIQEDLSYHMFMPETRNELLSGTIYFNYTPASINVVNCWIDRNFNCPNMWDQRTLQSVTEDLRGQFAYKPLPKEYIKILDLERVQGNITEPVIMHYQASRRFKKQMKAT